MMDADVAALQRFAEVPAIVESAPGRSAQAGAAAHALARAKGIRMGVPTGKAMDTGTYRAVLDGIRAQIRADLHDEGYSIELFDTSQKDVGKEARRASAALDGRDGAKLLGMTRKDGAFAIPFKDGPHHASCVIVGFTPSTDVDVMFRVDPGSPVKRQGLDDAMVHRMVLWHELGHCLLGGSEGRADTFAFLMALRHADVSKDALSMWASAREIAEWTSPEADDDHFMAKGLWNVIARADALRADPTFMAMDSKEVAGLAKAMWDELGYTRDEIDYMRSVRVGLQKVQNAKAHFLPTTEGLVRTDLGGWVRANVDIPELARVMELSANAIEGARPLGTFVPQHAYTKAALAELAADGDPSAKALKRAIDAGPPKAGKGPWGREGDARRNQDAHVRGPTEGLDRMVGFAIPYRQDRTEYQNRVIAFDPACQTVVFSADHSTFAVTDRAERRIVSAGDLTLGDARAEAEREYREAVGRAAGVPDLDARPLRHTSPASMAPHVVPDDPFAPEPEAVSFRPGF